MGCCWSPCAKCRVCCIKSKAITFAESVVVTDTGYGISCLQLGQYIFSHCTPGTQFAGLWRHALALPVNKAVTPLRGSTHTDSLPQANDLTSGMLLALLCLYHIHISRQSLAQIFLLFATWIESSLAVFKLRSRSCGFVADIEDKIFSYGLLYGLIEAGWVSKIPKYCGNHHAVATPYLSDVAMAITLGGDNAKSDESELLSIIYVPWDKVSEYTITYFTADVYKNFLRLPMPNK